MKTIRNHLAGQSAVPAPPPGATHALVWEPYGPDRARWVLVALDDNFPDPDEYAAFPGLPDSCAEELAGHVASLLGYPADLSSRIELDGEVGYYVTLGGGR